MNRVSSGLFTAADRGACGCRYPRIQEGRAAASGHGALIEVEATGS